MLSNKSYIYIAVFIFIVSMVSYFFSLTPSDNRKMKVQLLWQDEKLGCQTTFTPETENKTWFIEQFQFFISDIEFHTEHLGWQKALLNDTAFQANNTILLGTSCRDTQFENGAGNTDNWAVDFQSTKLMNDASRIRFTLGVPFEVNHLNPIHQPSPLNLSSMFWVWQTGHKFMRIELATNNEQWLFHLGSTGCQSTSVMRPPKQQCRYPNRFTFDLPITKQNDSDLWLNMDLAALLSDVNISSLSSCQSEHDNTSCQQLFTNLSAGNANVPVITRPSVFNAINTKDMSKGTDVE